MANDDVLIIGKLEDDKLRSSIEELVDYVGNQTSVMSSQFVKSMDLMSGAMKDFAITQKVSVDLMKESWRTMSASFDAMFKAQSEGTGGGKGTGKATATYPDNTLGNLEQELETKIKIRKEDELDSDALKQHNLEIEKTTKEIAKQKSLNTKGGYIKTYKEDFDTINALSDKTLPKAQAKLQQLIDLQSKYSKLEVYDKKQWNRLESTIDGVKKKIQSLTKKGATGSSGTPLENLLDIKTMMPEDSIDEIQKKMKALKNVKAQDAMESKALAEEYQRLKRKQHDLMGSSVQLTKSNNYLAQSFGYIRNRIVYALTLGAISSFVKNIYEIRGQYELLERSLGVLLNSFERGTQVFKELNQMAIESPFTLMELASGAKQLTAYNFAADEVVDTTRRLADISAALGVPMERLVYNLGQIRAQTVLNARDARDFANAGLPVIKMLSDYYTELEGKIVSTGDVYARMSKKMVSYSDVMTVINKTTDEGGKFFEFQAKQAQTLRVQMANLTLAYNNMLNEMGEANQTGIISLTTPIKLLKTLLQNWESINRVIKNLVYAFGLLKVAQFTTLMSIKGMTTTLASTLVLGNGVTKAIIGMGTALKGLFTNPWTWVLVGVTALFDLAGKFRAARAEITALNEEIVKTSQEASQANLDFLNNKGNKETRELAKEGKLSAEAADKAWQSIEEQLKTSSDAAQTFLTKLWSIDDANKRVEEGFNYVEKIQKAQAALQDLQRDIKITQDKGWWGIFGEGLVSDLKDLEEALGGIGRMAELFDKEGKIRDVGGEWNEYREELEVTAQSINNFIKEHKITDPLQITEILGRVKTIIKERNPEIKGELESLFDVTLDKRMSYLTGGAIDENLSLWKQFMERLKHNSSATFQDITREWATNDEKLSEKQQEAIDENLEYFKNTMPFYYESVKKMVEDASRLKIQIGLTFNPMQMTDFQKQVQDRINAAPSKIDFGNKTMWGTQNDDLESWVSTQQKAIKGLEEQNKLYKKDDTEWSKEQIKANDIEIKQRKNLLDLFHQSYVADKKNKGGSKKDVLGEALTKEVQLVTDIRKRFNEYKAMGMNAQDALANATDEYSMSLKNVKNTLAKFGIDGLEGVDVAGMELQDLVEKFKEMRKIAQIAGNTKGVEALEKAIASLNVEINKVNYKRITEGLNNELGKLKNEYELAVELDANPELGDIFADMLGIDTTKLPQTFGEAFDKANEIAKEKLRELKISTDNFDLMSSIIKADDKGMWMGLAFNSDAVQNLLKWQKTWRDMFKKNMTETEKMLDDYVKKYGEYSDKIAEIEAKRLEDIKKLNNVYYTEEMRRLPEYASYLAAINKGAETEKQKVNFDEFKDSRYYTMMFENLDYISTKTIRDMRDKIRGLIDTMNDLKPEQLKILMTQYEKLEQKLVKRSPFKTLIKDYKEYLKTTKDRKAANEAFRVAQKNYDAQNKIVASLKEQYKQEQAKDKPNQENLISLQGELDAQEAILEALRQQLNLAQEKADKYNLIKKLALDEVSQTATMIAANLKSLAELRDQMNQLFGIDASKGETLIGDKLDGLVDGLAKASDGISKVISSAQGGNVVGVVGGVVDIFTGIGDGIASIFGDGSARTKRLNREINESKETVRQLQMAYEDLERAIEKAMGNSEISTRRATIANKEAELAELERQKRLEESKRSKDRDDDAIKQYEEAIHSLKNEIQDLKDEVVNTLLGSDVKSAAESFVDTWVEAWKSGETTLDAVKEKMDDVVEYLIKKSMANKIVGNLLEPFYNMVDDMTKIGSEGGETLTIGELSRLAEKAASLSGDINIALGEFYKQLEQLGIASKDEESQKELSALQQGIQGITEDTAGALEAYMNGVSQQVYLQSDYLMQIRDTIAGFDLDVQVATMSQILLQLQTSYMTLQSMAVMMENWQTAAGNGIRVELLS